MDIASAIRFGGGLVSAIECTYEDYLQLALVCPECGDSVFLRSGEVRKPHFAHRRSLDPAIAQMCELRVSGYSSQELKKRANQSRNQRMKFLERHFVRLASHSPMLTELEDALKTASSHLGHDNVAQYGATIRKHAKEEVDGADPETLLGVILKYEKPTAENSVPTTHGRYAMMEAAKLLKGIDRRMHCLIITEVLEFLCQKRNSFLLGFITLHSLLEIGGSKRMEEMGLSVTDAIEDTPFRRELIRIVILMIAAVPWSTAFAIEGARLEQQKAQLVTT